LVPAALADFQVKTDNQVLADKPYRAIQAFLVFLVTRAAALVVILAPLFQAIPVIAAFQDYLVLAVQESQVIQDTLDNPFLASQVTVALQAIQEAV